MNVVVVPNAKIPVRGILSAPIKDTMELDLSEMQIKRVLNSSASVYVKSADGILKGITLNADGSLNIDQISQAMKEAEVSEEPKKEEPKVEEPAVDPIPEQVEEPKVEEPVVEETTVEQPVEEVKEEEAPVEESKPDYSHMTKAQRRAARREEQRKAAEAAANAAEDEAKDNAEVIEQPSEPEEKEAVEE